MAPKNHPKKAAKKTPTNKRPAATAAKPAKPAAKASTKPAAKASTPRTATKAKPETPLKSASKQLATLGGFAWNYAAAVACLEVAREWERQGTGRSGRRRPQWGDGGGIAEALMLAVFEGPSSLAKTLHKASRPEMAPGFFRGYRETAELLFERCGLRVDVERQKPGDIIELNPYAIHLQTDKRHPLYDRRHSRPPDDGLTHSIDTVGEVSETFQVVPYKDKDGVWRDYVNSGSRRLQSLWAANLRRLHRWYKAALNVGDDQRSHLLAPELLARITARVVSQGKRQKLLASVSNSHRLDEDVARQAEQVWSLNAAGYRPPEIAGSLGYSERKVYSLLSLEQLDGDLFERLGQGQFEPGVAYELAVEKDHKRQREAESATRAYKGDRRRSAIRAFYANEPLPEVAPSRKPLPHKRVLDAAATLATAQLPVDELPFARLLAAIAGDVDALAALPPGIQKALGPKPKPDKELAKWIRAGFSAEERDAWVAAGITGLTTAQSLRKRDLRPEQLSELATEEQLQALRAIHDKDVEANGDPEYFDSILPDVPTLGALYMQAIMTIGQLHAAIGKRPIVDESEEAKARRQMSMFDEGEADAGDDAGDDDEGDADEDEGADDDNDDDDQAEDEE